MQFFLQISVKRAVYASEMQKCRQNDTQMVRALNILLHFAAKLTASILKTFKIKQSGIRTCSFNILW